MDLLLSLFGVPAVTRHEQALAAAESAIGSSIEVRSEADALADAIRQLNATLDRSN